jgi:hypothetical protein
MSEGDWIQLIGVRPLFKENEKFRQTRGLIQFTANLMKGVWANKDQEEVFLIGAQFPDFSDQETRDQVKEIEHPIRWTSASSAMYAMVMAIVSLTRSASVAHATSSK